MGDGPFGFGIGVLPLFENDIVLTFIPFRIRRGYVAKVFNDNRFGSADSRAVAYVLILWFDSPLFFLADRCHSIAIIATKWRVFTLA